MTKEEEFKNAYNAFMNLDARITKTLRLIAIDAISKQIPKKCEIYTALQPRMTYDDEVDVYECPTCGTHIGVVDENNQFPHCWKCGQKLDWTVEHSEEEVM